MRRFCTESLLFKRSSFIQCEERSFSVSPCQAKARKIKASQGGEVIFRTENRERDERVLQKQGVKAARLAVERLTQLLRDPEASHADVLKAASLIFEKIYVSPPEGALAGDFDICVKGE